MAGILLIGGFIGTTSGIFIFKILQHFGQVDLMISVLYVLFLCSIGGMMFYESVTTLIHSRRPYVIDETSSSSEQKPSRYAILKEKLPYKMGFPNSKLYISAIIPLTIGNIKRLDGIHHGNRRWIFNRTRNDLSASYATIIGCRNIPLFK